MIGMIFRKINSITKTRLVMKKKYYHLTRVFILTCIVVAFSNSCQKDNSTDKPTVQLPVLTTSVISGITQTTASGGGEITYDGGASITARGICWNTNPNPTINNNKTTDGTGDGIFTSALTGLTANTTYYIRAYANNTAGTSYGNELSFITLSGNGSSSLNLTTTLITNITKTTASGGGNIISDGGSDVTARGVCWSTANNPTTNNNKTTDGIGTGPFISQITGLTASITYYVRAYAVNSVETAYGNEVSFITSSETSESTVTDVDGNIYNTVTIGTQTWMVENLKTTKYNDGAAIPEVTSDSIWRTLTTGAYCVYNNMPNNYGALYNWYAVNTGKLAPAGWHVPTNDEWTTLENYLIANGFNFDGTTNGNRETNNKIAKSLADTTGWYSTSVAGTVGNTDYPVKRNSSGFKALAGGYRDYYGMFAIMGYAGCWWSSSEIVPNATTVWSRWISFSYVNVLSGHYDKYYGFSIRCIKN